MYMKMENELLSDIDLKYYANLFNIPLIDVLSKDLFKNISPQNGGYILNLENSEFGGSHWTAFIISNRDNIVLYYDSFGQPIPEDILIFIKRIKSKPKIIYSIDQIQSMDSVYCGWYTLEFLHYFLVEHAKSGNLKYLMNKHNSVFNNLEERKLNDNILKQLIKKIYNKINI